MRALTILGAGSWGTALAIAARRAGRDVTLWARREELAADIAATGENRRYMPGVALDPAIRATAVLEEATAEAEAVLLVVPAQHLRRAAENLTPHLRAGTPLVICAKGIEAGSARLMSQILQEVLPEQPLAVLSGPTFAEEVAQGLPAAVTLAAGEAGLAERLVEALGSRAFRPYASDDVIGAQLGGAVKNVAAIACGIVAGRALGENARAALITRALAEITPLAQAMGGRAETLIGLSGLGDLTLTCTGAASRNYTLGMALGRGEAKEAALGGSRGVAEGVYSADGVVQLADRCGVDMPICRGVDAVLNHAAPIEATIDSLLSRPFRTEIY